MEATTTTTTGRAALLTVRHPEAITARVWPKGLEAHAVTVHDDEADGAQLAPPRVFPNFADAARFAYTLGAPPSLTGAR
jgi:hypothetical protein